MQVVSDELRVAAGRRGRPVTAGLAARLTVVAALCSLGAATIHALAAPAHLDLYRPLGVSFLAAAFAQAVWPGLALGRRSRAVLFAGIAGNLAVAVTWGVSRTLGLPVGPEAGAPEPVGALDLMASVLELVLVAACVALLRTDPDAPARPTRRFAAIGALAVAVAVAAAVAADLRAGEQSHHHEGPVEAHAH